MKVSHLPYSKEKMKDFCSHRDFNPAVCENPLLLFHSLSSAQVILLQTGLHCSYLNVVSIANRQ